MILLSSVALAVTTKGCDRSQPQTLQLPQQHTVAKSPITSTNQPRGLFLNSANLPTQKWSRIVKFILNDTTVSGANIVVPWSKVDRGVNASPQYDWSYVYEQAQPWIDAGKTVNLLLWGAAQKAEQEFDGKSITPAYVLAKTPTITCQCKVGGRCASHPPQTPVFWDQDYQKHYRDLVEAAIAEFSDQSWVCLLYTSPSPRDLSTSRMPSSA